MTGGPGFLHTGVEDMEVQSPAVDFQAELGPECFLPLKSPSGGKSRMKTAADLDFLTLRCLCRTWLSGGTLEVCSVTASPAR